MTLTFKQLNLHEHLLQTIENSGFTTPTPIQEQSIPHILEGGDVMACAQTGTGKTAAFTLPVAHRLLSIPRDRSGNSPSSAPRAVVLAPTRELADQVLNSIKSFIKGSPLKAGLIVGGVSYKPQIQMLHRTLDILVATPGRFIDHMEDGRIDLSKVEVLILDEADRMLDMGFVKPVEKIVKLMPNNKQTLLFSATFDSAVKKLAKQFLTDPTQVTLASTTQKHDNITQSQFPVKTNEEKSELLRALLEDPKIWQTIVFMRTKHAADRLAKKVAGWGHDTAALHGDMRQSARKRVIEQMYKGKVRVLVATDVAARGLDVKELTHVINFDLPQVAEDYIHRIGRTGRAGASGIAYSFVNKADTKLLRDIERMLGHKIEVEKERPASAPAAPKQHQENSGSYASSENRKPSEGGKKFKKTRGSQSSNRPAPNKPGSKKKAWSKGKSETTKLTVQDSSAQSEGSSDSSTSKKSWKKDSPYKTRSKNTGGKSWSKDGASKSEGRSASGKSWSKGSPSKGASGKSWSKDDSGSSEGKSASGKSWSKGSSSKSASGKSWSKDGSAKSEGKSASGKSWSKDAPSKSRAKKSGTKSWSKSDSSDKPAKRSEGFRSKGKSAPKRGGASNRNRNSNAQA